MQPQSLGKIKKQNKTTFIDLRGAAALYCLESFTSSTHLSFTPTAAKTTETFNALLQTLLLQLYWNEQKPSWNVTPPLWSTPGKAPNHRWCYLREPSSRFDGLGSRFYSILSESHPLYCCAQISLLAPNPIIPFYFRESKPKTILSGSAPYSASDRTHLGMNASNWFALGQRSDM